MSSGTTTAPKGLEGVVATNSSICYIDGDRGILAYRGIDIHELADNSTFEETCYLLWFGRLPKRDELKHLQQKLAEERRLDPAIIDFLRRAPKMCYGQRFQRCHSTILRTGRTITKPMCTKPFG